MICVRWARRGSPCAGTPWRSSAGRTPWARPCAGSSTRHSATPGTVSAWLWCVFCFSKIMKIKCSLPSTCLTKLFYFWAFNKDLMGWLIELWDRNPTCWNWRVWNISDITRWQWRRTGPCVRWSPRPSVTSPAQVRQWDTTFQTNLFMGPVNYVLRKWNQF